MGLFSRHANIPKPIAEAAALEVSSYIHKVGAKEFMSKADDLVPKTCESMGIFEELSNDQYKEIAQAALFIYNNGKVGSAKNIRDILKHFK